MIRKPFKGQRYYEWQIGPLVFQIRHNARNGEQYGMDTRGTGKRFNVWIDHYWKTG